MSFLGAGMRGSWLVELEERWAARPEAPPEEWVERRYQGEIRHRPTPTDAWWRTLYAQDRLAWGRVVNVPPGMRLHPRTASFMASFLWTWDRVLLASPGHLEELAQRVLRLTLRPADDPLLQVFSRGIRQEAERQPRRRLPPSLGGGRVIYWQACMLDVKTLPGRRILSDWIPLMVGPPELPLVWVVPLPLWPETMRAAWGGADPVRPSDP